jgi:hypothetical protein
VDLANYEAYLRQEMSDRLRKKLEHELETEHNVFSKDTQSSFIEILKSLQLSVFLDYRKKFEHANGDSQVMPEFMKAALSHETTTIQPPENDSSTRWEDYVFPPNSADEARDPLGVFDDVGDQDMRAILDIAEGKSTPDLGSDSGYNTNGPPTGGESSIDSTTGFQSPDFTHFENEFLNLGQTVDGVPMSPSGIRWR